MVKVNYDYPLNPTWNKPCIFGSSLEHRWYVYANYIINEKRFQFKESSGLNDKRDTLEIRIQKAETVKSNLIEKLLTRPFEPKLRTEKS